MQKEERQQKILCTSQAWLHPTHKDSHPREGQPSHKTTKIMEKVFDINKIKEIFKTAKSRTSQGIDTTKLYCGPYNEILNEATNNKQK